MSEEISLNQANRLFAEGMKYDWRQDKSPAAATLARAAFQQAASMGHDKAIRSLAHMTYEGRGGSKDEELALRMLWSAFNRGDHDALEELDDMFASYAESPLEPSRARAASSCMNHLKELRRHLAGVSGFMHELVRERARGR